MTVHLTLEQRKLMELARAMARTNPHAAEELAKHLRYYSGQELRPDFGQGAGISLTLNPITGRIDLRSSE